MLSSSGPSTPPYVAVVRSKRCGNRPLLCRLHYQRCGRLEHGWSVYVLVFSCDSLLPYCRGCFLFFRLRAVKASIKSRPCQQQHPPSQSDAEAWQNENDMFCVLAVATSTAFDPRLNFFSQFVVVAPTAFAVHHLHLSGACVDVSRAAAKMAGSSQELPLLKTCLPLQTATDGAT